MAFHEQLKRARLAVGLTQQQVADALGIQKSTYSGYERASRQPDPQKIKLLASILQVSADTLLEINGIPEEPIRELDKQKEQLLKNYELLNDEGKENLVEYSDTLVFSGKYRRNIKYAQLEMDKEA